MHRIPVGLVAHLVVAALVCVCVCAWCVKTEQNNFFSPLLFRMKLFRIPFALTSCGTHSNVESNAHEKNQTYVHTDAHTRNNLCPWKCIKSKNRWKANKAKNVNQIKCSHAVNFYSHTQINRVLGIAQMDPCFSILLHGIKLIFCSLQEKLF